jgi:histidine ammonia-lyase
MIELELGVPNLTLEQVESVARNREVKLSIADSAREKMQSSRDYLAAGVAAGKTIYGVNTGFGLLSNVKIAAEELEELQYNLLRSHAVGVGPAMNDEVVRAMLLLRAHNLSIGHSGVRPELVEQIIRLIENEIHPIVPQQGSVGASGDLAPLAHLALVLIGEGEARVDGEKMSGADALKARGIKPIRLEAKEGLALINGTQFMTAIGTLSLLDSEYLADAADSIAAVSLEALRGTTVAFDPAIHEARFHPGQIGVAKRMQSLLGSESPSEIAKSHVDCTKVQDPYSLRCIPQVHGASREILQFVRGVLEREVNAVTDNPLVFPEQEKVLSGGNFHGQIVAMAMDTLSIAMAEFGSISEQRIEKLINPAISELPAFLTKQGGLNSGFMIVQVAAASVVSENKTLCHPLQSIRSRPQPTKRIT